MPPNLFRFATSELSQDAFICWLISWGDPQYEKTHEALHGTALSLLNRFLDLAGVPKPIGYSSVEVGQQVEKIGRFDETGLSCDQVVDLLEGKRFSLLAAQCCRWAGGSTMPA